MSPYINVVWPAASGITVVTASFQDSKVTSGQTGFTHTHTLDAGAEVGDIILWHVAKDGGDGGGPGFDTPAGLTALANVGVFRHFSMLFGYPITSGDISAGSVSKTFVTNPTDDENFVYASIEVKGLASLASQPIQTSINTSTSNVETAAGESLTGVVAGNLLLGLCCATPDGGTVGLAVDNLQSFTDEGVFPQPIDTAGSAIHFSHKIATAGGAYTGPSYTNDSTTGPGNITNPGLIELGAA